MRPLWNQKTSVTRDFLMLSVVIVFIAILASFWVAYSTFNDHNDTIKDELRLEAERVDNTLDNELNRSAYLLEAISHQIIQRNITDTTEMAQLLRTFDTNNTYYNVFLWVDENQQAVTSSRQGVLEKPVDLSDRDYIKQSLTEPFRIQVGHPVQGRISQKLVLPMGLGLTDFTGKYLGTVTLSLDLKALTTSADTSIHNQKIGFLILDQGMAPLTSDEQGEELFSTAEVHEAIQGKTASAKEAGILIRPSIFSDNRVFAYFHPSTHRPYVIVTAYASDWSVLNHLMLPRLIQLLFMAAFLVSLLWLVRFRIIHPVQNLAEASGEIARGNTTIVVPKSGPLEISYLGQQLQNVVDYIAERKRIEEELVAKVLSLKTAKDLAEVSDQAKMEILRSLKGEIFPAMELILTAANIFQEQPYGAIKGKEYKRHIDELDTSSTHLTEVIYEIFEFPKMELIEPLLSRKPVDVNAIIHKCTSLLRATTQRAEVSLTIKVQNDLPKITMNELHLMHVIIHLLTACLRSLPAGSELAIEAMLEESNDTTELAILFKDNGTGLDTQEIARLWRANEGGRRVRTHTSGEDERDLSYQAITLTKKIITLHNGRMSMQNPPGKEAIIAVYFQQ